MDLCCREVLRDAWVLACAIRRDIGKLVLCNDLLDRVVGVAENVSGCTLSGIRGVSAHVDLEQIIAR